MKKANSPLHAEASQSHINDTSTEAQRTRLLAQLKQCAVDTLSARRDLNILAPAARVKELRQAGHSIQTQRMTLTDEQGRTHHGIALYYLSSAAAPAQAEA
jgi:hypothetical protein